MDAINEALQRVFNGQCCGWNNVLDILIVAVFIYYVLVLIRGTRAVQLLLGVLVLVAIYGLAVLLKLELTKFVLSAVFAFAVFALLIVFQPELRRALGQLGQLGPLNRLLVQQPEEEVDHIVDELVRAALLIAEARHGALIVVERSTGLQDYSETGAAACLLPLEETPERAAHRYGMRHRAALSVSSQTDAVVVVVSEETQAISIASNGRMIGGLDEERLRRVLSSLLRSRIQPLPFRSKAS
ncbi:MAG: TIGR00159 family protein [Chloroflexi bacterium]|nr:MAG: TIGR00159 family protein [Chloroflexota bacterium]